jgi:CxxC motif-containing protein (DUF1111 family)
MSAFLLAKSFTFLSGWAEMRQTKNRAKTFLANFGIAFVATLLAMMLAASMSSIGACAQKDPGPRAGAPGAGFPYSSLSANELSTYSQAFLQFVKPVSVSGTIEKGKGLGPTFNGNSCAMCHAQPSIGGSSPGMASPEEPHPNPQIALARLDGADNSVPPFITTNGPVMVARFVHKPDGSRDGEVHGLFTIAGRSDAKGCDLRQPDFAHQFADNNVALRIPTALFGLGLVENTSDATLRANLQSTAIARSRLGIGGTFNISANDGTITRFGWKAHNKSLLMFAGEAASIEEGVTNELFPGERDAAPGCEFNSTPEDSSKIINPNSHSPSRETQIGTLSEMGSDIASNVASNIVSFATFVRFLAPPKPAPSTQSTENGGKLFTQVGCVLCHSSSLTTGAANYASLSRTTYHPYSDFALHHMGPGLADGIYQGQAGSDQFRTAPLWGIGQRLFFLHDGRTADLLQAILEHSEPTSAHSAGRCEAERSGSTDEKNCFSSEATNVIRNFKSLRPSQIQDILNFLRSL